MQISLMQMTYVMACIFGAAVIRGYSGFGFSMLAIVSLSPVILFFFSSPGGIACQSFHGLLGWPALGRAPVQLLPT
jgi:hypothetical protein